jgi:hypothetical protein
MAVFPDENNRRRARPSDNEKTESIADGPTRGIADRTPEALPPGLPRLIRKKDDGAVETKISRIHGYF